MTQRWLGLARVLLHEPQVLLLDEPAAAASTRAPRIDMRNLLKELRNMGKTILVSSHILPELADICNKIGIIERGQLLFDGDVQTDHPTEVRQNAVYFVAVGNGQNPAARELLDAAYRREDGRAARKEEDCLRVTLADGVTDGSFMADLLFAEWLSRHLKMLKEEEIDLEDVFMGITKGITN